MLYQRNLIEEYVSKLEMRRIWTLLFFKELQSFDFEEAVLLRVPVTKCSHFYSELFWDGDRDCVRMEHLSSMKGKMYQMLLEIQWRWVLL